MEWADRIGRRIKLQDLHILLAVAQAGSMARAAEMLAISQPVVSKVIADLERNLDVRILDRSRRGVELTPSGEALLRRGVVIFDELRQGVKEIEFLRDPAAGEVRMAGPGTMVDGLFPAAIERLSDRYPRIVFHVTQEPNVVQQIHDLRDRKIDLVVRRLPRAPADEDLATEILLDDPMLIAVAPNNSLTRCRRIDLGDLVEQPWVLPPSDTDVAPYIEEMFRKRGLEPPRARVVCASMHMNHALLATGRYLAIYPGSLLHFSRKRLSAKVLPVELPIPSTPIGIITLKNRSLSPVVRLFIETMREVVKPLLKARPRGGPTGIVTYG